MKKFVHISLFLITLLFSIKCVALEFSTDIPSSPNQALIVIHGWRQNGKSMEWMGNQLKKDFPDMAFYYPTAPDKAPNGGYQWFVIPTLGEGMNKEEIYNQMMSSALDNLHYLHKLITYIHQTQNIDYNNIHITGFSQGGFMALMGALTYPKKIGKVISFSGVPVMYTKDFQKKDVISYPDVLIIQGNNDTVIPSNSFDLTQKTLKTLPLKFDLKLIFNMPHTINDIALNYAKDFLKN
ncbi:MAG: dienelactone hydrolase family protein [Alphaproteobacteria bacterium]|nr:dienelactone hydrolase family protein [Alphaproteobacteria bacterium]